jgi:hypothetical protein
VKLRGVIEGQIFEAGGALTSCFSPQWGLILPPSCSPCAMALNPPYRIPHSQSQGGKHCDTKRNFKCSEEEHECNSGMASSMEWHGPLSVRGCMGSVINLITKWKGDKDGHAFHRGRHDFLCTKMTTTPLV